MDRVKARVQERLDKIVPEDAEEADTSGCLNASERGDEWRRGWEEKARIMGAGRG